MRFGIKAREAGAITLLTFLVVATTTVVHLSQLTRVVVQEAARQAELIARQIYAQSSRSLSRARGGNPKDVLRKDRELRSLLDSSVGYSPHLLYALITDVSGRVILHTERDKEGSGIPERPNLGELLALDPVRRFRVLYEGGTVYEAALPVRLGSDPFGTVRIGISTSLLGRELRGSLKQSLALAGAALPVAWLVAMVLANLILKPIRTLTREMDRLRRGEFDVGGEPAREDEIGELASHLQILGQQLQSDRLKMLGEKAQLQQAVDYLEDGVIFVNQERRMLFFNKAIAEMVGKPLATVVGGSLDDVLEPSHPLRAWLEEAFEHTAGFRNVVVTLPTGEGSKEFLVSVFFVTDAAKTMGTMVLLRDLESIKTLQSLISYSAKLAALGRLTSGVAHEVKNPLNAMMIHLELLKEKLDNSSEEVQGSLEVIGGEIRRLDRAVQGFLKFIRPQELSLKPVDLNALLKNVAALLEAEQQQGGIQFASQLDPTLPSVTVDEELLHQAFLNIMLNACQAMPTGGAVCITTEREKAKTIKVSISDQGVGIPPEDLDKIFTLYYTTKPEGSGIGLSMVYRIIQMHDGTIEVESEVGRGTTVIVRLPVS
jgi:signal transduction histidine kinase